LLNFHSIFCELLLPPVCAGFPPSLFLLGRLDFRVSLMVEGDSLSGVPRLSKRAMCLSAELRATAPFLLSYVNRPSRDFFPCVPSAEERITPLSPITPSYLSCFPFFCGTSPENSFSFFLKPDWIFFVFLCTTPPPPYVTLFMYSECLFPPPVPKVFFPTPALFLFPPSRVTPNPLPTPPSKKCSLPPQ